MIVNYLYSSKFFWIYSKHAALAYSHSNHLRWNQNLINGVDDAKAGFDIGDNNFWKAVHTGRDTFSNLKDFVVGAA